MDNLTALRKYIQHTHLLLIISVTILLSIGGAVINIKFNTDTLNENLQNTAELITRLYTFTRNYSQDELVRYMDSVVAELPDVDVVSIIDRHNRRYYHSHHELINTGYDGIKPEFEKHGSDYYTESSNGPSGPQVRTYSAVYNDSGEYDGFIMTIRLNVSTALVTKKIIQLFLLVTILAIAVELLISSFLSRRIRRSFMAFTEDFEGTKFLVDAMRANNHDFTNKLHVILGLIQIGEYEKAVSYIENVSIIQRETITKVMKAIDNPSFAALIVGKIARASECNVRFVLKSDSIFNSQMVDIPSEALVTITGNLIDNALDAMNINSSSMERENVLTFGVFTQPGELLITVKDTGVGLDDELKDRIFENGFSTKGTGRGIGLHHTRQLVESMGGIISCESQKGHGACFMVRIKKEGC